MGKKKRLMRYPKKYGKKYASHPALKKDTPAAKVVVPPPSEEVKVEVKLTSTKVNVKKTSKKRTSKKRSSKK